MTVVTHSSARDAIVEVDDLKVWFANRDGMVRAVDGVSFDLLRGETLGIVGESGCGKSVTAMTLLQLIPSPPSVIAGGAIRYNGEDLLKFDEARMRTIRGNEISMIFQDPMTSSEPGSDRRRADRGACGAAPGAQQARRARAGSGDAANGRYPGAAPRVPTNTRTSSPAACASGR